MVLEENPAQCGNVQPFVVRVCDWLKQKKISPSQTSFNVRARYCEHEPYFDVAIKVVNAEVVHLRNSIEKIDQVVPIALFWIDQDERHYEWARIPLGGGRGVLVRWRLIDKILTTAGVMST